MSNILESLTSLFERDIDALMKELKAYKKEENLWLLDGNIANTGGNLVLHLCGNLRHFVGAILGGTSYIRQRDDEFGLKDVKKSELVSQIKETKKAVLETLKELPESKLDEIYPVNVFGKEMTTFFFLQHLHSHLTYHLGQLNYHRRLFDK